MLIGRFGAMACPCEVLVAGADEAKGVAAIRAAAAEATRIEAKFSRYQSGNIIDRINSAGGQVVDIDPETARLLDFSARAFELSGGLFDVTSGVLRRAWTFDGSGRLPDEAAVEAARALVGWTRVEWDGRRLRMPAGMQIDLGGVGKEYAVDRALDLARAEAGDGVLVNFGGDIAATPRPDGKPWKVGVERADTDGTPVLMVELTAGGLTTSGDSKKFLLKDGRRYGHILNPRTGRPVEGAPRSVTVAAASCTEAGLLSTLGMLHGPDAERFLKDAGVKFWIQWG